MGGAQVWGGLVNSSRAFGMMVNDFVGNLFAETPVGDDELRAIRRRMILRHVAWLTALRHALRASRPWETLQRERTNREWARYIEIHEHHVTLEADIAGYLPPSEADAVCRAANPAAQILGHQSRELRELRERGLLDDFRHMEMQNVLGELVADQGRSERIKNFPYPRQYATLNAIFLWIFIVLIPFGLVREFAEIGEDVAASFPGLGRSFVWFSLPFSVIVMWIFHTMERIGRVTENPFEGSPNDVPITTMARGIEIDLRQLIGDDPATIPGPIPPRYDTQS